MEKDIEAKLGMPDGTQPLESATPSALSIMEEKERQEVDRDDSEHEGDPKQGEELQRAISSEYPKAFRLVTILVAVILSVFLVALDMVRTILGIDDGVFVLTQSLDHRCNRNPQNHR